MSEIIGNIIKPIEAIAPLSYQESYDNAGLQIGNINDIVSSVLLCIDVTEEVIDEAITLGAGLIISHHPLIFNGIKRLTGSNYVERCVVKAIKNNIAIYSAHTNLDAAYNGVNAKISEKLSLQNVSVLSAVHNNLVKIMVYVPNSHAENVRTAMFDAGAGNIGNYDQCSFNVSGTGTFRGNEASQPFVGKKGELHYEDEVKIEVVAPKHLQSKIILAIKKVHPYEEVAFDIVALQNTNQRVGIGMIGELAEPQDETVFLQKIKAVFGLQTLRYSPLLGKKIKKVAVCGGSGSSFLRNAIQEHADIFISGDIKYHEYFSAENKIVIVDIGHYESEFFTKELFYDILTKNNINFAVHLTGINTNPIKYL